MRTSPEFVQQGTGQWDEVRAEFVEAQAGQCAICRRTLTDPHLDHCHATGFIRGALCSSCNTKLGWYETNRKALEEYIASAAEHAAYVVPPRLSRSERLRHYWQGKAD